MRTPLLLSSLLALGVLPPLPKPRTQEDLDLEASERMMNALWAADINPADVVASVGPARFVETGRAVLAVAKHHAEQFGTQPPLSELLGIVADLEAAHLRLREMTPREPLEEAQQAGFTTSRSALQEALDDSEHKRICAYRPPSEHTMTEALADAVTRAVAAEGEAALLRAALAKRDATISVLREPIAALSEREATITELRAKDRASIVAFLAAEAKRIDDAAERVDDEDHGVTGKRLRAQASIGRTWTAQIERGDDRNGADTALVKPAITGRLVTVGQITTCDNDCADSGDYNFTTMSGALIVMDDDSVRAAAGLFGKVIEIRGVG